MDQTYLAADFISSCEDNVLGLQVIIQDTQRRRLFFKVISADEQAKLTKVKHTSLARVRPKFKRIKKQEEVRVFVKRQSVFAAFTEATPKALDRAFEADWQFVKVHKFVKDARE